MAHSVKFQGHQFLSNTSLTLDADTHVIGCDLFYQSYS